MTVTPERIQRKRTKGWRMPEGAVFVGRPSKWGNPFRVDEFGEAAVEWFEDWLAYGGTVPYPHPGQSKDLSERRERILADIEELRGKDLVCWCHWMEPCHADVLLEFAKSEDVRVTVRWCSTHNAEGIENHGGTSDECWRIVWATEEPEAVPYPYDLCSMSLRPLGAPMSDPEGRE